MKMYRLCGLLLFVTCIITLLLIDAAFLGSSEISILFYKLIELSPYKILALIFLTCTIFITGILLFLEPLTSFELMFNPESFKDICISIVGLLIFNIFLICFCICLII